jgi:putative tricarboxylic transport membrane protein
MRISDATFGLVLLVGALALFIYALTLPGLPGQDYGPALFPKLLASGFGICGLVLLVSGLRREGMGKPVQLSDWARSGGHIFDLVLMIGGLILLIWVWDIVGFLIGAALYAGGLISRFRGGRFASSFAIAFIACLIIDWSFRRLLLVPLPLGPLTGVIW